PGEEVLAQRQPQAVEEHHDDERPQHGAADPHPPAASRPGAGPPSPAASWSGAEGLLRRGGGVLVEDTPAPSGRPASHRASIHTRAHPAAGAPVPPSVCCLSHLPWCGMTRDLRQHYQIVFSPQLGVSTRGGPQGNGMAGSMFYTIGRLDK